MPNGELMFPILQPLQTAQTDLTHPTSTFSLAQTCLEGETSGSCPGLEQTHLQQGGTRSCEPVGKNTRCLGDAEHRTHPEQVSWAEPAGELGEPRERTQTVQTPAQSSTARPLCPGAPSCPRGPHSAAPTPTRRTRSASCAPRLGRNFPHNIFPNLLKKPKSPAVNSTAEDCGEDSCSRILLLGRAERTCAVSSHRQGN